MAAAGLGSRATKPASLDLFFHQYASLNVVIIGSGYGLAPVWFQSHLTSADIFSIGPLGTNFNEIFN